MDEDVLQEIADSLSGTCDNISSKGGRHRPPRGCSKVNTEYILFIIGGGFIRPDKIIPKRSDGTQHSELR